MIGLYFFHGIIHQQLIFSFVIFLSELIVNISEEIFQITRAFMHVSFCDFVDSFCESDTNQYAVDSTPGENYLRDRLNNAFQSWYQSVLDIESFEQKTKFITDAINKALYRRQLDGLLSSIECVEVLYINSLWHQLMYHISIYRSTCLYRKREIMSLLMEMELYTYKQ